ncbi:Calmodulin-binding protein-related [Dorcoceras hygrometricum]|uniref:Calmodulin-binding protein-related n=1 Tax=Dorcoceras hygrometricum TaxID=472368 RepID=A0A2Z7BPD5_9LAMI|nr:Calmodulin-binding protein-related [Dorcoceras hygrometricum]
MDLLLKLESVQGGDPMIRDGRKSIGRQLNQFLDWVTKWKGLVETIDRLAEELEGESDSGESHNSFLTKNQVTSGNRSGILLKQHGGAHPRVTKNVRFADNGKAYSVSRNNGPLLEEDCPYNVEDGHLDDAERQLEDDLCREVEVMGVSSKDAEDEDEEENHLESGGSLPSSDGEEGFGNKSNHKADQFVFADPLPVKMGRRDHWIGSC